MIRRDRHVLLVLVGMLVLNILTALASVSACYVYRRRFHALSEDSLASCKASEKACVEASASALLLVDLIKDRSLSDDSEPTYSAPVIRGFGQTRSRNAIYIYRDVEQQGVVRREFIERIPFASLGENGARGSVTQTK